MADTQNWKIKEYSDGGQYRLKASATWAIADAARFQARFAIYTKASNMTIVKTSVDGSNDKLTLQGTNIAAGGGTEQQIREAFLNDIDGIQTALAVESAAVATANTATTGGIDTFCTTIGVAFTLAEP